MLFFAFCLSSVITTLPGQVQANESVPAKSQMRFQGNRVFPAVTLPSLTHQTVWRMPEQEDNRYTLVALGFDPAQQTKLEQSISLARRSLSLYNQRVQIIEIAVVDPKYQPFRQAVETFMRGHVQQKALLPAVYPFYTDAAALQQSLGLTTRTNRVFLFLSPKGLVLWNSTAPLTTGNMATLQANWLMSFPSS